MTFWTRFDTIYSELDPHKGMSFLVLIFSLLLIFSWPGYQSRVCPISSSAWWWTLWPDWRTLY